MSSTLSNNWEPPGGEWGYEHGGGGVIYHGLGRNRGDILSVNQQIIQQWTQIGST